MVTHISQH